jgi:hypothetical protein
LHWGSLIRRDPSKLTGYESEGDSIILSDRRTRPLCSDFKSYPRENVEEEWFDVVVESFVVEKELDQEAKVLTVDLVRVSVHLEHGEIVLTL